SGSTRSGCGSATRGVWVGGRRSGRRTLRGHIAGLGAEALATTGAARLGVKRHGQHPHRRNRQYCHGEESRKTLRHYECLLLALRCAARVVKKSLTRSESYRKLKKRTMPGVLRLMSGRNIAAYDRLTPSCRATMPALMLKYFTREKPASSSMEASSCWPG